MAYSKRLKIFVLLVTISLMTVFTPLADGTILPIPPRPTPPHDIRKMDIVLKKHNVKINVLNSVCQVKVEETFLCAFSYRWTAYSGDNIPG